MSNAIRSSLLLLAPLIMYAEAGIVSLHPLYTPETAVRNPALVDLWTGDFTIRIDPIGSAMTPAPIGESGYQVIHDAELEATFHLVQLGGETLADIVLGSNSSEQLPAHVIARLRLEGNTLRVALLGSEKLVQRIALTGSPRYERLSETDYSDYKDALLLTASTAELRRFVLDCLKQPDAFNDSDALHFERAGPEERAADLDEQSWSAAMIRGASAKVYAEALKQAEEAVTLVSDNPDYWTTLGAAQYRAGQFSNALLAISRAAQLRQKADPRDLVFQAMAHQGLGETVQAKDVLGELQKMTAGRCDCDDRGSSRLLREAEDLIAPKAK